jgi:hypothetical protein
VMNSKRVRGLRCACGGRFIGVERTIPTDEHVSRRRICNRCGVMAHTIESVVKLVVRLRRRRCSDAKCHICSQI